MNKKNEKVGSGSNLHSSHNLDYITTTYFRMKFDRTTAQSIALLGLLAMLPIAVGADKKTCAANPECAALGLVDNCCPTNLAGIFLDCCENAGASCAANSGCSGLQNNCCPTDDGTFLYCCFEPGPDDAGYQYEYTYFANARGDSVTKKSYSTGTLTSKATRATIYEYTRSTSLYDLLYLQGGVPDAGMYVTGNKTFSIVIKSTTAPDCTQIMLQLDSIPDAKGDNYPIGRHSRYLGTITPDQQRIEFTFLDRPDENVLDEDVNAVALFFDPGSNSTDTYTFRNLDSNVKCDGGDGCQAGPTKSCPALYVQIAEETTERRLQDSPEVDCSDCRNPACMGVGDCVVAPSYENLELNPELTPAPSPETETDPESEEIEAEPNTDETEPDEGSEGQEPTASLPGNVLGSSSGSRLGSVLSIILVGVVAHRL